MSFQAYLDTVKAKTGKTPDDFRALAAEKGLATHGELVAWLKADFGLGHGHANAVAHVIAQADKPPVTKDAALDALFPGPKAAWRPAYDALAARLAEFGSDLKLAPNRTYVNIQRGAKKIGIVQMSAADRMDIGIKRKGVAPTERFEEAGAWNSMVTHRVRISDPSQIDADVLDWLRQAYDAA
ncbi:MAG TPA: DUF4287 domain-containing protein [Herpetosiphonaceae bacterium]